MVNQIAVAVLGLFYDASASQGNSAPILQVEDFIVSVARDCSGIESSTLFLFLFAIVLLFDNTIKNNFKTYLFVGLGVAGAFLITALRVILLSIVGVEISPELAVTSFHANIGWVLFVLYVFIFYAFLKKYSK